MHKRLATPGPLRSILTPAAVALLLCVTLFSAPAQKTVANVTVFYEPGRYGGWPANHGIWHWGNEIVVGFTETTYRPDVKGFVNSKDPAYDRQARSQDGGMTWTVEPMRTLTPDQPTGAAATDLGQPIDFQTRDFALKFRFADASKGPSWFYVSHDRCHTWSGPYNLPNFGMRGIAVRTSYEVLSRKSVVAYASGAKGNGREGRPFVMRTDDGGLTWRLVSWMAPEPKGYAIMPSVVRLSSQELFAAIRREEDGPTHDKASQLSFIEGYRSKDNGMTWQYEGKIVPSTGVGTNPPSMLRLKDGRLSLIYGHRGEPWSIRARLSADNGKTWSDEYILRQDGTANDLGYVRSVQRDDGKVVAVYYFNAPAHPERTIDATIWDPGKK